MNTILGPDGELEALKNEEDLGKQFIVWKGRYLGEYLLRPLTEAV